MIDHLSELLAPLGKIHHKQMFGCDCLLMNGAILAIVKDDDIFIKKTHIHASDTRFGYLRQGKVINMNYVLIDNTLLDEPDELIGLVKSFLTA